MTELPIPSASDELNASMSSIEGLNSSSPRLISSDHIAPDEMIPRSDAIAVAAAVRAQRLEHRPRERVADDDGDARRSVRCDRVDELVGVEAPRREQDHGAALARGTRAR